MISKDLLAMSNSKIPLWKTGLIIVGFPVLYMVYGHSDVAYAFFGERDRSFYIPFWAGIVALHWLSVLAVWVALRHSRYTIKDVGYDGS